MTGRALLAGAALWMAVAACGSNDGKLKVTGLEPRSGDSLGGQYVIIHRPMPRMVCVRVTSLESEWPAEGVPIVVIILLFVTNVF